jgi:hypothetical protein
MNDEIMKQMNLKEALVLRDEGKCTTCREPIVMTHFRDDLSKREYKISGMCRTCQDFNN